MPETSHFCDVLGAGLMVQCTGEHEQGALVKGMGKEETDESGDSQLCTDPDQHGQGTQGHDRGVGQYLFDTSAAERQISTGQHSCSTEKHQ